MSTCNDSPARSCVSVSETEAEADDWTAVGWLVLDYLHVYYVPVISVVGIFGNLLSMAVFLLTPLRSRSSSYYLAALAAADITFLTQLLVVSLSYVGVDVYNRTFGCQTLVYLSSVATFLSVWLIVGFTVERFIAIQYPLQRPNLCTVQRARLTIAGLVTFSLSSYSYIWFSAALVRESDGHLVCDVRPEFRNVFYVINIVDTIAMLVLPVTLILVMNTMIAVQLFRFSRCYRDGGRPDSSCVVRPSSSRFSPPLPVPQPSPSVSSDRKEASRTCSNPSSCCSFNNNHLFGQRPTANVPCVFYTYGSSQCAAGPSGSGAVGGGTLSHRAQYNITKMLLVISTVFLCLNLPSYAMRLHNFYSSDVSESVLLVQQYTMILFYTNFSVNFLLYSTYGVAFRKALNELSRRIVRSKWSRKVRKQRYGGFAMGDVEPALKGKQVSP